MNETEMQSRTGGDVSPVRDVTRAVEGFTQELKNFQDEIHNRIQKQEEKMSKLDRKTFQSGRPALSMAAELSAPHEKAFDAYLRSGDEEGLRGLELEGKALNTAVAGDGGYLVDPQTAGQIQSVLTSTASIRAIANVVNVEATSFDVLVDHSEVGHGWATEAGTVSESDTPTIDRITIPLNELSALPKASQRLLDDSAFDI